MKRFISEHSGNLIWGFDALRIFGLALFLALFSGCEDNNDTKVHDPGNFADGIFVLNEGAWGASNSSVSFIPADKDTVFADLFITANGEDAVLGDVLMDMVSVDTLSYLVLNSSHSVMVVNNKNFEYVDEITGEVNNPRHAIVYNGLIYLTQWGKFGQEGAVLVIDPFDFSVVATIATGQGAHGIKEIDGKIWVANSGGYGYANTVSIINPESNSVERTIEVGDCPQNFVVDYEGNVWVLSSGYTEYDDQWQVINQTEPYLTCIDGETYKVSKNFQISSYTSPTEITISKDKKNIYFGGGSGGAKLWKVSVDNDELPSGTFSDLSPYGISVHPETGNLYCGMAPDFTKPGSVIVLDNEGNEVKEYNENIGVGPRRFIYVSQ